MLRRALPLIPGGAEGKAALGQRLLWASTQVVPPQASRRQCAGTVGRVFKQIKEYAGGREMRFLKHISRVAMIVALPGTVAAYESEPDQPGAKSEVTTTSTCPSTGGGLCTGLVGYWKLDVENADGDWVTPREDETACDHDLADASDDIPPYTNHNGDNIDGMYSGSDRLGEPDRATACLRPKEPGNSCHLAVNDDGHFNMEGKDFTVAAWLTRRGNPVQLGHDIGKGITQVDTKDGSIHDWYLEIQGNGDGTHRVPHVHFCVSHHEDQQDPSLCVHLIDPVNPSFNPNDLAPNDFFFVVGKYRHDIRRVTIVVKHGDDTWSRSASNMNFTPLNHLHAPFGIGAEMGTNMKGADEVMVWQGRALSTSDINALYANGSLGDPLGNSCVP